MPGEKLPPSKNNSTYWIGATNRSDLNNNRRVKRHTGKWLIFTTLENIDSTWAEIKAATEDGQLGHYSCVSTTKHDSVPKGGRTYSHKVICVMTYSEHDFQDIVRVRGALATLGYKEELGYKTWKATATKQYAAQGKSVCKYRF